MAALRKMLGDMNGSAATALMRLIETQSRETLTRWASAYAKEHYLPLIKEEPGIFHQMEQTLSAVESVLNKEITLKELKPALADARRAAKQLADSRAADPVSLAAARAVSTACSTAQTPTNAFGFLLYGAAARAYHSAGLSEAAATYDRLAEEELKRALLSLQAAAVSDEPNPVSIRWNC